MHTSTEYTSLTRAENAHGIVPQQSCHAAVSHSLQREGTIRRRNQVNNMTIRPRPTPTVDDCYPGWMNGYSLLTARYSGCITRDGYIRTSRYIQGRLASNAGFLPLYLCLRFRLQCQVQGLRLLCSKLNVEYDDDHGTMSIQCSPAFPSGLRVLKRPLDITPSTISSTFANACLYDTDCSLRRPKYHTY